MLDKSLVRKPVSKAKRLAIQSVDEFRYHIVDDAVRHLVELKPFPRLNLRKTR